MLKKCNWRLQKNRLLVIQYSQLVEYYHIEVKKIMTPKTNLSLSILVLKSKTGKILTCVSPPSTFSRVFLTSHPCSLSLSKIPFYYTTISSCIISLFETHYRLFHYVFFFFLRPKHLCAIFIFTLYMSSNSMNYSGILDFHGCWTFWKYLKIALSFLPPFHIFFFKYVSLFAKVLSILRNRAEA